MKHILLLFFLFTTYSSTAQQWGSYNIEGGVVAGRYNGANLWQNNMGLLGNVRMRLEIGTKRITGGVGFGVLAGDADVRLSTTANNGSTLSANPSQTVFLIPQLFLNHYWKLKGDSKLYAGAAVGFAMSEHLMTLYSGHYGGTFQAEVGWVKSIGRMVEFRISESWMNMATNSQRIEGHYKYGTLNGYTLNAFTTRIGIGIKCGVRRGVSKRSVKWSE